MANTIVSSGTVTANISTLRLTNDISFTQFITGSNVVSAIQTVPIGGWTGLSGTSSLSDVRWIIASNEDETGSIALASNAAGSNQIAYLRPGDSVLIPWTGSATLVAQAYTSASLLQFVVTEQ